MQETENNKGTNNEIDLIEVFKKIWSERKLILKVTAVFFVLGIIIAFGTPKEYSAETTLFVETRGASSVNGLLQQFSGIAGLSLGGNQESSNLNPKIYPKIVQSAPFLVEIMGEKINSDKTDSAITVYEYLSTQVKPSVFGIFISYTIGLPRKIINAFKKQTEFPDYSLPLISNKPLKLSGQQIGIMGAISSRVKIQDGEVEGTLKISTEMPDPVAAAELTNLIFKYLSKYLIEYKIQKVKTDLDFISKQYFEARQRYMDAQQHLANYRDANQNVMLASYRTEEERLQNEYTLAFNVYNGLAQQLEQAKLKVQENTPVLKVMDPVKVPLMKSKPKRGMTIFVLTFLGGLLGIGFIFGRMISSELSKKYNQI